MNANLYDFNGDLKGKVDLPEALFGGGVNKAVLYDAVKMYLANRRSGTAKTKERGEIAYSTVKPYKQKGTGRARAGMRSSPVWRGGGTVFGPRPRDYRYQIPRKVKRLALKSALAGKGESESVAIVEGVAAAAPKTKPFVNLLRAAGLRGKKVLFVTGAFDDNVYRSVRNIDGLEFAVSNSINAYEILRADYLVLTREALANLEEVFV